jgi:hypothetical protein
MRIYIYIYIYALDGHHPAHCVTRQINNIGTRQKIGLILIVHNHGVLEMYQITYNYVYKSTCRKFGIFVSSNLLDAGIRMNEYTDQNTHKSPTVLSEQNM